MVELLIGLAITAVLLAAVAVAFNASVINCEQNENIFKSINSARQALVRLTTQLRTAQAVDPAAPVNECTMITADGDDITYRYSSTDKKLYLITNSNLSDTDYTLCGNVTSMNFQKEIVSEGAITYVKNVQIVITVTNGGMQQTLSAAATVRRSLN